MDVVVIDRLGIQLAQQLPGRGAEGALELTHQRGQLLKHLVLQFPGGIQLTEHRPVATQVVEEFGLRDIRAVEISGSWAGRKAAAIAAIEPLL